jgi:hypothetical protein
MYAAYRPSLIGEPWEDWMDSHLVEDYLWGCTPLAMALRARRTEAEVIERLAKLGYSMADQPEARRIRSTTWTKGRP